MGLTEGNCKGAKLAVAMRYKKKREQSLMQKNENWMCKRFNGKTRDRELKCN